MIADLKAQGYRVYIRHHRRNEQKWVRTSPTTKELQTFLSPKGGKTEVEIVCQNGTVRRGEAFCSKYDCYNKKRGVMIALGRALKAL
jgi:hypothetical protein